MIKMNDIREAYLSEGFSYLEAGARTCKDVILTLIGKSSLNRNVTMKGGVLMQHLSGDGRRATQDIDLDFIHYSLNDDNINKFINKLNSQTDEINIKIISDIEELKHQDYNGKRVTLNITDSDETSIDTKLDIGVHKNINMEQKEYYFDLDKLNDSVTLLANTKEQIFAEKLKVLLRLANLSTRYKDIFDMYWLIEFGKIKKQTVKTDIQLIIYDDVTMKENSKNDIILRLHRAFDDQTYITSLNQSKKNNWLNIDPAIAMKAILKFLQEL